MEASSNSRAVVSPTPWVTVTPEKGEIGQGVSWGIVKPTGAWRGNRSNGPWDLEAEVPALPLNKLQQVTLPL